MSDTQRINTAALIMIGVLALIGLIVGATLRHYIGGFMRTIEREAQEQEEAEEAARGREGGAQSGPPDEDRDAESHRSSL